MPEGEISPGMEFVDERDESEHWFVKYADDEVVVSRKTDERYHKFNRREAFEKMSGLNGDDLECRFRFTGETVENSDIEGTEAGESEKTASLLDL